MSDHGLNTTLQPETANGSVFSRHLQSHDGVAKFNETNSNEFESSTYRKVSAILDMYSPPILVVMGITCNTLVIFVMRMRYFRHVSTSLYISTNAFVDNMSLLISFPPHWLHVNFPALIYRGSHSHLLCKLFNFVGWGMSNLGVVLTAAMTIERAIAVTFPLKAASMCTTQKAKRVTVSLVVLVALKDAHFLILSDMVPIEFKSELCTTSTSNESAAFYANKVWPVIQQVFLFATFLLIIVSNIIIIQKATSSSEVGTLGENKHQSARSNKMRQLSIMLIVDSITVITCTLPLTLVDIIDPQFEDPHASHLIFSVCFYLVYVNRCANFFLYCISGGRFRQGLRKLVCGKSYNGNDVSNLYTLDTSRHGTSSRTTSNESNHIQ